MNQFLQFIWAGSLKIEGNRIWDGSTEYFQIVFLFVLIIGNKWSKYLVEK